MLDKKLRKVLIIGSGPIVIGQAAEFDYAGTQGCRVLKEEGLEVVLINSNPATIMTDNAMADAIYIEPLTLPTIKRIILKEKPDALLSTLGGQNGLTLSMQLEEEGFLAEHGVTLLGASLETINKAEDRKIFKETMQKINQPCIPSEIVNDVEGAVRVANEIGYPVIIRPAFTLGGSGGGRAENEAQLREISENGIRLSPISQILIEKNIAGWKEIEFEVIRDSKGGSLIVCSMENLDPVGVHTGDSIVVAPAVSLSDKDLAMLKKASLDIVEELGIIGGCNCQFALHPDTSEYAVIEVNPRVSRSSALASKATGFPIAKVAARLAVGYTLDEIPNCKEPVCDYLVCKFPKWPFDKFVYAKRELGTQMKATGEVMTIAPTFEQALMKAVRGAEIGMDCMSSALYREMPEQEIAQELSVCTDRRIFVLYEAMRRGMGIEELFAKTKITRWFLDRIKNILDTERELEKGLTDELYIKAKNQGFPDKVIERLSGGKISNPLLPKYKTVETLASGYDSVPYFYADYNGENKAEKYKSGKETVLVLGSGPIRIGQGIEFDYASVHCVKSLKRLGYEVAIINNNPETVSTDFDTADRLYFEALTEEDVWGVIKTENPIGAVVAFGGQTAIKLTNFLNSKGIKILGTAAEKIDEAEDREKFDALLESLKIKRPQGLTIMTEKEALEAAEKIGFPVLMRPSYVLGGQNMIIAFNESDVSEYMKIILAQGITNPVLIDKYLSGMEIEVDAICDGEEILIPGIMEHIERAGIHSGDSIAIYPAIHVDDEMAGIIVRATRQLALALNTCGLVNIQYLIYENELYVIEVNLRSSRTVPYISKVTGIPMVDLATRAMLGEKIDHMGFGTGLYRKSPYVAVKVPVFSFEKLINVDTHLGPEMNSTGEVLGIAGTVEEALYKGLVAAGYKLSKTGGVFISVRDSDKTEISDVAKKFEKLGFTIYATRGTAEVLTKSGIKSELIEKIHESDDNALKLFESGKIGYIISTSSKGRFPTRDSVILRRKAVERSIPCLTSIDTAHALCDCLASKYSQISTELVDINKMRADRQSLSFTKMSGSGNDYILFNCFDQQIDNPEGLTVRLADRYTGIGGEGAVFIYPSKVAACKIRMFNLDGSEGKMYGNAIRCVAKYLYDNKMTNRLDIEVETASGIKTLKASRFDGEIYKVTVDMGAPVFTPSEIPVKLAGENIIGKSVKIGNAYYDITCLSMGNPHCVVFCDDLEILDIEKIGPTFENAPIFPERINTEFVKVISKNTLKMRVFERGSGETRACGTGACAAAVAACLQGFCNKNEDITVKLKGGELTVRYTDETVYMTGNAVKVFDGTIKI